MLTRIFNNDFRLLVGNNESYNINTRRKYEQMMLVKHDIKTAVVNGIS